MILLITTLKCPPYDTIKHVNSFRYGLVGQKHELNGKFRRRWNTVGIADVETNLNMSFSNNLFDVKSMTLCSHNSILLI